MALESPLSDTLSPVEILGAIILTLNIVETFSALELLTFASPLPLGDIAGRNGPPGVKIFSLRLL